MRPRARVAVLPAEHLLQQSDAISQRKNLPKTHD